jgi:isopenicillin N synthase-like dioxygenase
MSVDVPMIDISALVTSRAATKRGAELAAADISAVNSVAQSISRACRLHGFFYISNHGVPAELINRVEELSKQFFLQDEDTKMALRMALGGRAWRGYFPVGVSKPLQRSVAPTARSCNPKCTGIVNSHINFALQGELTSGKPDMKEGLYFGTELPEDHPLVLAKTPVHGSNLFPTNIPLFKETILEYMDKVVEVGHAVMEGIALSLGLPADYFQSRYTNDPLVLFRIFNYPVDNRPLAPGEVRWGVGAHTDYGLLTILRQDNAGGLQVRSSAGWIDAPPVPDTFVCNIGDMLDRMTHGLYRSTLHRVRNTAGRDRLSFPLFFDPNYFSKVGVIDEVAAIEGFEDDRHTRWDHASVHDFSGTYGDYLLAKVSKVFPELRSEVL